MNNYPIEWSAINNKPNISVDSNAEVWEPTNKNISITSNVVNIGGTTSSKIYVLDSTTKTRTLLEDYPTAWGKVSSKPRAMGLFGYVFVKASSSSDPDEYWPAVAVKDSYQHSNFSVYKFNGFSWERGDASEFIAFTDTDSH